jgi:predicted RNA binding protein YcfA (HicA-like mRNA interferase family)
MVLVSAPYCAIKFLTSNKNNNFIHSCTFPNVANQSNKCIFTYKKLLICLVNGVLLYIFVGSIKINNKMKRYKVKEIISLLEQDGWILMRQKGSHRQFRHPSKSNTVTVNGKLSETMEQFLINSIFKQAGWK